VRDSDGHNKVRDRNRNDEVCDGERNNKVRDGKRNNGTQTHATLPEKANAALTKRMADEDARRRRLKRTWKERGL
jgi:hypothetical protein